ncbi:hypothetical protein BRD00_12625 [Halobacteriales archaeon QS_8_69_26]|nr:MAG: hypothetical protein BRD00_12625 [Halobacteriales archaeon QS_8_69_26]
MRPTTSDLFRVFGDPRGEGWLFVRVDDPGAGDGGSPAGDDPGETRTRTGPDDEPGSGAGVPRDPFEPVAVPMEGHGEADPAVAALRPGYLVEATLEWDDRRPTVRDLTVRKRTLLEFVDGASTVFQAAAKAWAEARTAGEAMNSRVTRSTDGDPNGVLYVFADGPGAGDLFEEFRSARRPLEPLIARVNEAHDDTDDAGPDVPGLAPDGSIRVPTPGDDGAGVEGDGSPTGEREDGGSDDDADVPAAEDGDEHGPDREVFVVRPADEPFVIVYIVLRKGGVLADAMRDTYARPRPEEPIG